MKIKKIYQGELPENKILNAQSTSQTDTYSCEYINDLQGLNYISVRPSSSGSRNLSTGYIKIGLGSVVSSNGNKLTLSNDSVVIGAGISKIRVSGQLALWNANGTFGVAIVKNDDLVNGNLILSWGEAIANKDTCILTTTAYADVQEGDVISLYLYATTSQTANVQNTCRLNVEVIG